MGSLIVILFVLTSFALLALLVLTVREVICLLSYLWRQVIRVMLYALLGLAAYLVAKHYLDPMSSLAMGILTTVILNAFAYQAYRKRYMALLAKSGLGDSRRISRKKLLEVYQLGGNSVDRCGMCGESGLTLDIHHKLPLSEGGTNELANLKLLCPNCHRREHDEMRG
ncbi:MAG: HNH endonuclease [Verrucomicrobiales bacterium]|nr:HNH endonuclease [Verrucomicrobiales bacterium]